MTQDAPGLVSVLEAQSPPFPAVQTRLAQWAYRLAYAEPFAFLVMALLYPPADPFALPAFPVQLLWWTLALASPLGGVALLLMHRSPAQKGGENYGLAAMLIGCATTFALPYGTHYLNNIRKASYTSGMRCDSNLRQLNVSMLEYTQDYDEYYPPGASWNAATLPYTGEYRYFCPEEEVRNVPSYALNRQIQGKRTGELSDPARTVLLFDSVPGRNQFGGQELLPRPDRHQGFHTIALGDGHVKSVAVADINAFLWTLPPAAPSQKHPTARGAH